jgi:hypothetical protein
MSKDLFPKGFALWRISWKFTDDGNPQQADFWLPEGDDPHQEVGDLINLVELSASEYGYEYELKKIGGFRNA